MPDENTYSVPALEKGMRILEDLAASSDPLSIAELAANQGRGRNEIYRMLCCLESLGYITREEATKRYGLSLRLFQLANRYPPLERLRLVARQPLQELADQINESCHLCVLDGDYLSVVAQASGSERILIAFQLGARFDPMETCSGKLLLSELDEAAREQVLEASDVWKSSTVATRKSLLRQTGENSPQRLWQEDSQLRPGVHDIAVALGTPDTIHATVTVAHLSHRKNALSISKIRSHVIATAREIEKRLGLSN